MDDPQIDELLAAQTAYYRARAATYDLDMKWDTNEPELRESLTPVYEWFADLPIYGEVLELACGTGAWTGRLARRAAHVHAVDVAPEMVERAQTRVAALGNVTFEVADLYRWRPPAAYDVVFFSFLLSHVPTVMAPAFWQLVASSLKASGVVAFVDAAPDRRKEEAWLDDGVAQRALPDGSQHRIVKVFPTPGQITAEMSAHRLDAIVELRGSSFLVGTGRQRSPEI